MKARFYCDCGFIVPFKRCASDVLVSIVTVHTGTYQCSAFVMHNMRWNYLWWDVHYVFLSPVFFIFIFTIENCTPEYKSVCLSSKFKDCNVKSLKQRHAEIKWRWRSWNVNRYLFVFIYLFVNFFIYLPIFGEGLFFWACVFSQAACDHLNKQTIYR